jgi:hypothetical protein
MKQKYGYVNEWGYIQEIEEYYYIPHYCNSIFRTTIGKIRLL